VPSTPAWPKICCLYAVAERHNITQHREAQREKEKEKEKEKERRV